MKKILLFFLALMPVMLFTSCSDDDDFVPEPASILNTWHAESNGKDIYVVFNDNATATEYIVHSDGSAVINQFTYDDGEAGFMASGVRFKTKSAGAGWTDWDYFTDDTTATYRLDGNNLTRLADDAGSGQTIITFQKTSGFPADAPDDVNEIAGWEF